MNPLHYMFLASCLSSLFQPGPQPKTIAQAENAALTLALADALHTPQPEAIFVRYIWITDGNPESMQGVLSACNQISRASLPHLLPGVKNETALLVRVNLKLLYPKAEDLAEALVTWEEFQFDPRFNLLLTADTLKFAAGIGVDVPVEKAKAKEKAKNADSVSALPATGIEKLNQLSKELDAIKAGAKKEVKQEAKQQVQNVQLLRVVSEHLNKKLVADLVQATNSQAPVVSHSYFITRALSQVQGKGIFQTIYGGLYYRLAGIKKNNTGKGTDEDLLFEGLGVGNVQAGITAEKLFDQLRSDQRVVLSSSDITSRIRRADVFPTLVARDGGGIVSVTHDVKRESIDLAQNALFNLVAFKDDAREVVFTKSNGALGYALFDGAGKLQDSVPFDVATDGTIPHPYVTELQPAISCIRCHGTESGWRILRNDLKTILKGRGDVFGDASRTGDIDRIAGLYAGDLELQILPQARVSFARATLLATGPWKVSKDQTDVVKLASAKIGEIYARHNYTKLYAADVLADLGVAVPDGSDAKDVLAKLLPPVKSPIGGEINPEDVRILGFIEGVPQNRVDMDLVYSFIATRAQLSQGGKK